jgi:hypothetical protein
MKPNIFTQNNRTVDQLIDEYDALNHVENASLYQSSQISGNTVRKRMA